METYHYLVQGRVQGVSFRYYTKKEAIKLNISGTVKNLINGDVEIFAIGSKHSLLLFEDFLTTGPVFAQVKSINKKTFNPKKAFNGFEIIS